MTIFRICRHCGKNTPFDQLIKNHKSKDGVDACCKTCATRIRQIWADKNPEKQRSIKIAYKHRDRERNRQQSKADYERHKKKRNAHRRKEYARNPGPELETAKAYRQSTEGRLVQRVAQQKRRARKLKAGGTFTKQDVIDQYRRQKDKCYWCDKPLLGKYEVDHVIPLARGGDNTKWNIVCVHIHCNRSKNDKLPHEWEGSGGKLL